MTDFAFLYRAWKRRKDGSFVRSSHNQGIILQKPSKEERQDMTKAALRLATKGKPIGTEFTTPFPRELRQRRFKDWINKGAGVY